MGYSYDVLLWISGPTVGAVEDMLEVKAKSVVEYMAANFLALNPDKTQILWVGSSNSSPDVTSGESAVMPVTTLEVFGLKFDNRLRPDLHLRSLVSAFSRHCGHSKKARTSPTKGQCN